MSELILASASPRRRDLLQAAGVAFAVRPAAIDEGLRTGEVAADYALRMAREKALAVDGGEAWVLGADTVVQDADRLLGKPADLDAARRMLRSLAGRWHTVTTAFCLARAGREGLCQVVDTRVRFRELSDADIDRYLDSGEALDKAGAYGIQGLGGSLVDRVEGSYTNVVGLPLPEVLRGLRQLRGQP